MTIIDEIKESYKKGTTLNRLIYINIGVFLLVHIIVIVLVLANQIGRDESISTILQYLAIPAEPELLLRRPWTLITYMFTHGALYHILFNLMVLYWFGRIFLQEFGEKKLLAIYLLGGIAGGLLYFLFYNIFPFFEDVRAISIATGASASIMAIVVAVAAKVPNKNMQIVLIGPVKIVYVAIFLFVISTVLDFTENTGGKIAHIGGAVMGYVFATYFSRGKDITRGFDRFMDNLSSMLKPNRKNMKVTHKRPSNDIDYNKEKASEKKELDRILDKISKGGYDSLTKAEKEMLFNMKK